MALTASQIGKALMGARTAHGMTRPGVAAQLGVDPMTIYRWEKGTRRPPRTAVLALAAIYQRPSEEFGVSSATGLDDVPRGAMPAAPPLATREGRDALRDLRLAQNDVERNLIELGASDDLLDEAVRLFTDLTRALRTLTEHARAGTRPPATALPTTEEIAQETGARSTTPAKVSMRELERGVGKQKAAQRGGRRPA